MKQKKATISLCMIVKNEENLIGRCLDSVKGIEDEIIIVDTGSKDKTKEIVGKYTDKVYDYEWIDDFSSARNFSFSKATQDYILWLDADDVIKKNEHAKIITLKENLDPSIDAVSMYYDYISPAPIIRRHRLVKRSNNFKWFAAVHEYLQVSGNVVNSDITITHQHMHAFSDRNIRIYEKLLAKGDHLSPRDRYLYAQELQYHSRHEDAERIYIEFLNANQGEPEDCISVCGKLADHFLASGNTEKHLEYIYKSFNYDTPRAEFCCRLGSHYFKKNQLKQSIFWYKTATELEKPSNCTAIIYEDYWTWLPHVYLCECYERLGKNELSFKHHELAAGYAPDPPGFVHNREYFNNLRVAEAIRKLSPGQIVELRKLLRQGLENEQTLTFLKAKENLS